jgi:hypothetical protein
MGITLWPIPNVPLVAATPVQDLRFRARVLLKDAKSAAPLAAHDRDGCAPAASGIGGGEVVRGAPTTLPGRARAGTTTQNA